MNDVDRSILMVVYDTAVICRSNHDDPLTAAIMMPDALYWFMVRKIWKRIISWICDEIENEIRIYDEKKKFFNTAVCEENG